MRLPLFDQLPLFRSLPPSDAQDKRRHIQLGNRIVSYQLRQAPRRRLTLSNDERGLRVGAPRMISIADIESFIRNNAAWVNRKLDEYASDGPRQLTIHNGQRLPLLGDEIEVSIVAGANRIRWSEGSLLLEARADADLNLLARRALQRRAQEQRGGANGGHHGHCRGASVRCFDVVDAYADAGAGGHSKNGFVL